MNMRTDLIRKLRNLNPTLAADLDEVRFDWYRIRNASDSGGSEDTTEVYIYEEIGGWFGMLVDEFIKELSEIKTKRIDVRINSPGGSLFDSIAIYNALVKKDAYVTTYVDAIAASGASIIAMAGDEIVMMLGSQLMIHDALGVCYGNPAETRDFAEFLEKQSDNVATVYRAQAGGDVGDWRALMRAETWMFADEAVSMGLASKTYSKPTDAPDEEDDDKEPEEPAIGDDEEEGEESTEDSEDEEEDEEPLDTLMSKKHTLANRGYKYAGRKHAPTPPVKISWDKYVRSELGL